MPLDEMVPTVELPPVVPLTSQVTVPVLPLLEVAVNGWVPPAATVMLLGAMLKVGGPEGVEDPPPPPQAPMKHMANKTHSFRARPVPCLAPGRTGWNGGSCRIT